MKSISLPVSRLVLSSLFFATAALAETPATVQARSASEFLDSMGLCVRIADNAEHEEIVRPRLDEMGIRHIRVQLKQKGDNQRGNGEIQMRRLKELGQAGYQVTGLWHCWYSMDDFLDICDSLLPDALFQVEGPNEPWHRFENFKWKGEKWPTGAILYAEDMHTALKSRESTSKLPIVSFSGTTTATSSIEQWIDFGNEHIYTDNGESLTEKGQLEKLIERCRATQYPTKPLQFTEAGYNSDPKGLRGTSPWTQTRGVSRIHFETFRQGIARTFIYALYAKDDGGFSLLDLDGTPKPAFTALQSIRTILKDDAKAGFEPGTLDFSVLAKVPSVHHLLLQRSDGTFFLCLWNDVGGWDSKAKRDKDNSAVPVQIAFAQAPASIAVYQPATDGIKPLAPLTASSAQKSVSVRVLDHPLILEIVAPR